MPKIIQSLAELSGQYDALFCDLWGCFHNGQHPFPDAVAALRAFREQGGTVVLVTNSPRPTAAVLAQLDGMGAPRDCYDAIASSGDAAQTAMAAGMFGRKVYHLGPERDLVFFTDANGEKIDVERVPLDQAEGIICTGLFDDRSETPKDYRLTIATGVNRGLKLLCANPDIVVDVGDQRIYCAGAIAKAYSDAGGESSYFGKPHPPIYDLARRKLTEIKGHTVPDGNILCVGDGIRTDIQGGIGEGIDTLFIAGGLAADELDMKGGSPDAAKLDAYFDACRLSATTSIGFLR